MSNKDNIQANSTTQTQKASPANTQPKVEKATTQPKAEEPKATAATAPPKVEKPKATTATTQPKVEKPKATTATTQPKVEKPKATTATAPPKVEKPKATAATAPPKVEKPKATTATTQPKVEKAKSNAPEEGAQTFSLIDNLYSSYKNVTDSTKKDFDKLAAFAVSQKQLSEDNTTNIIKEYDASSNLIKENLNSATVNADKLFADATDKFNKNIKTIESTKQKNLNDLKPKTESINATKKQEQQDINSAHQKELSNLKTARNNALAERDKALKSSKDILLKSQKQSEDNKGLLQKNFTKNTDDLTTAYNCDIAAFDKQIKDIHTKYFSDIDQLNNSYDDKIKALSDEQEQLSTQTQQSNQKLEEDFKKEVKRMQDKLNSLSPEDKAAISAGNKDIKVATSNFNKSVAQANKELIKALSQLDKDKSLQETQRAAELKQLRIDFINQLLPIENAIRKRKYSLDVDTLREETLKSKNDNAESLKYSIAQSIDTINNIKAEKDYNIKLAQYTQAETIAQAKLELDQKLIQYDLNVYNANEAFILNEFDLQEQRDKKVQELKLNIAKEDNANAVKVAQINNKYAAIELELDKNSNILYEKMDRAFATANEYYNIWNNKNGITIDALKELSAQINQPLMDEKTKGQFYNLYSSVIDTYIADTQETKEGSIKGKITQSSTNQKDTLKLIKTSHQENKSYNKKIWNDELINQKSKYSCYISNLEQKITDTLSNYEKEIENAKQKLQIKLDGLLADKNKDIEIFNNFKLSTEKAGIAEEDNFNKQAEKEIAQQNKEQQKFSEEATLFDQEQDSNLNKKIIEQEKLNIRSDKLTNKTIKYLLKNAQITNDTKWWVVEL